MGDSFTNFLLVTLIALLGYIAKIFYSKLESFEDKLESFEDKIEKILLEDMAHTKDIQHLQERHSDHEKRITNLENEQ